MNQEIINVTLFALDGDNDILRFSIDVKSDINLNKSDCQNAMKSMFSVLLKKAVHTNLSLKFSLRQDIHVECTSKFVRNISRI